MKKIKTTEDLCNYMWNLEKKYNLLDLEIDNVKVWQYKRMQIFYLLSEKTKLYQAAHLKQTKSEKIINLFSYIKNSILNNPFLIQKTDEIIFDHPRTKIVDDENIDIYTHYLIEEFISTNKNFCIIERPYEGKHLKKNTSNRSYLDFIILVTSLLKKFIKINLSNEIEILKQIEIEINKDLNIKSNISNMLMEGAKEFKIRYKLFYLLLKKIKPKKLYLVVSYVYGDLIKAAKDLNVETFEIQHGTYSEYHLGYNFPKIEKSLDYFPDNFIVWNNYWKNLIKLPIKSDNILIRKFDYLENEKKKYSNIKNSNQIVVLSQGAIGENIANEIYKNYDKLKDYSILYKLHPGEYKNWKNNKSLYTLSKKENIEICLNVDLYELLSSSKFQIGVFSTAIYEGIEFNCETILLDLPGIEYMDKLIEMNQAILFNDWLKKND